MWVPPPGAPLSSVLSWLRSGLPIPAALLETVQAPAGSAPQRATLYRMATGDQAWQPLQGGAQRNPTKYGEWQTGAREGAGSDAGSAPLSHRKRPPPSGPPVGSPGRGQAALHSRSLWTMEFISSTTSLRFSQQTRAFEVVLGQSRAPSSLLCSDGSRACRGCRTTLQLCMCQSQGWRHQAQCPSLPAPPALKLSRTRMAIALLLSLCIPHDCVEKGVCSLHSLHRVQDALCQRVGLCPGVYSSSLGKPL